jgi:hypothetical protein
MVLGLYLSPFTRISGGSLPLFHEDDEPRSSIELQSMIHLSPVNI